MLVWDVLTLCFCFALLCLQNLDGACIQSVNLMVDEDPRTEITMSHSGEVFLASQFRISLPYSDGNVLQLMLAWKCATTTAQIYQKVLLWGLDIDIVESTLEYHVNTKVHEFRV